MSNVRHQHHYWLLQMYTRHLPHPTASNLRFKRFDMGVVQSCVVGQRQRNEGFLPDGKAELLLNTRVATQISPNKIVYTWRNLPAKDILHCGYSSKGTE